ncbi:hypothetical protein [Flavobacterium sp. CGRL2]
MKKHFLKYTFLGLIFIVSPKIEAQNKQEKPDELSVYRVTPLKTNDLIHTKLEVSFDYGKRYLYGKEWVTLKPHFYETDSLHLDAKGMDFKEIAIVDGKKNYSAKIYLR